MDIIARLTHLKKETENPILKETCSNFIQTVATARAQSNKIVINKLEHVILSQLTEIAQTLPTDSAAQIFLETKERWGGLWDMGVANAIQAFESCPLSKTPSFFYTLTKFKQYTAPDYLFVSEFLQNFSTFMYDETVKKHLNLIAEVATNFMDEIAFAHSAQNVKNINYLSNGDGANAIVNFAVTPNQTTLNTLYENCKKYTQDFAVQKLLNDASNLLSNSQFKKYESLSPGAYQRILELESNKTRLMDIPAYLNMDVKPLIEEINGEINLLKEKINLNDQVKIKGTELKGTVQNIDTDNNISVIQTDGDTKILKKTDVVVIPTIELEKPEETKGTGVPGQQSAGKTVIIESGMFNSQEDIKKSNTENLENETAEIIKKYTAEVADTVNQLKDIKSTVDKHGMFSTDVIEDCIKELTQYGKTLYDAAEDLNKNTKKNEKEKKKDKEGAVIDLSKNPEMLLDSQK